MSRPFLVVLLFLQLMFPRGGSARPSACADKETDMKCYYCSSHYDKPKIYEECCVDKELRTHCFEHIWIEPKRDRHWWHWRWKLVHEIRFKTIFFFKDCVQMKASLSVRNNSIEVLDWKQWTYSFRHRSALAVTFIRLDPECRDGLRMNFSTLNTRGCLFNDRKQAVYVCKGVVD